MRKSILYTLIVLMLIPFLNLSDASAKKEMSDSLIRTRKLLQDAKVKAAKKEVEVTVRSVDITQFPEITIIIEAYNKIGEPLDNLTNENLYVYENGEPKKILRVRKIPVADVVPVDFVFVIDQTGTMQKNFNSIRKNIEKFTKSLVVRGIDYRLGLVLFSDDVEMVQQLTDKVSDFTSWLRGVEARNGGDIKENALEALEKAARIKYRDESNKVVVLITDAPYHQKFEDGQGVTNQTTESITQLLIENDMRLFSIVPPKFEQYHQISRSTRGTFYDIDFPFSTILDNFSKQLTNLFALTYRSDLAAIPDSIQIGLLNEEKSTIIKKTIPIVELGRKLIIENLLYESNRAALPNQVNELDVLADFMMSKKGLAIMIEGHTDFVGSHATNDWLSKQRAESVKGYLVKKGVAAMRIKTKGYGERRPIASNKTLFGRRLNRRTEIVIVSK